MSTELVSYSNANGVVHIRFERGERHNSLTLEMFQAIVAAGERLAADASARVAVLHGSGKSFCAGLDLGFMREIANAEPRPATDGDNLLADDGARGHLGQQAAMVWRRAPVPVIAAVHGVAFGGGFQIAGCCDIRIAHPDARLCIMETRYGLIPDMGITQFLPELMPRDQALALTLSAAEFGAEEALRLGLVTEIADDPLARADAMAADIAARSPDAVRASKQLYNQTWHRDEAAGLALEAALQRQLVGGANQREAVAAAMARRAADFDNAAIDAAAIGDAALR